MNIFIYLGDICKSFCVWRRQWYLPKCNCKFNEFCWFFIKSSVEFFEKEKAEHKHRESRVELKRNRPADWIETNLQYLRDAEQSEVEPQQKLKQMATVEDRWPSPHYPPPPPPEKGNKHIISIQFFTFFTFNYYCCWLLTVVSRHHINCLRPTIRCF